MNPGCLTSGSSSPYHSLLYQNTTSVPPCPSLPLLVSETQVGKDRVLLILAFQTYMRCLLFMCCMCCMNEWPEYQGQGRKPKKMVAMEERRRDASSRIPLARLSRWIFQDQGPDTLPRPNTDMITNPAWIRVALALQQLSSALCPPPLPQMASPEEQNRWYLPGAGYKNQGHSDAQVPFIPDEVRAHSHRKSLFNINVTSHMRWTQASHTMSLGI